MRPALGLSILAFLVTGCAGAASLPPAGSSVSTSAPTTSATPSQAASSTPTAAATAAPSPLVITTPSPPTSTVAPPAPAHVMWSQTPALGFGAGTTTMTVTWTEAVTAGMTVRVYGVTQCLNPPGTDNVPCLVKSTKVPEDALTLVATAPAAQGSVSWTWPSWGNIGQALAVHGSDSYYAFVVSAYTATGHSTMVIVTTAGACSTCTT